MRPITFSLAAALTAVSAAASTARAQGGIPIAPAGRSLTGTVGIGVVALPRYAGSDEYRVLPLPFVQLEYKRRLYLGGTPGGVGAGIGAYLVRSDRLTWDVGI